MVDVISADSTGTIPHYSDRYDNLWVRGTLITETGINNGTSTGTTPMKLGFTPWSNIDTRDDGATLENTRGYYHLSSGGGPGVVTLADGFVDGQLTNVLTSTFSSDTFTVNFREPGDALGEFNGSNVIALGEESTFIWDNNGKFWVWIARRKYN